MKTKKKLLLSIAICGVIIMAIFAISGDKLSEVFSKDGTSLSDAFDIDGVIVFSPVAVPSGDLTASEEIRLPDQYEIGKGFTCTGLAYDETNDVFLVGDIGILLPNSGTIQSQIVKLSTDFSTVIGTIPLYQTFAGMSDIQGITLDSDGSIWFCSPSENKIRHISSSGSDLGSISVSSPTGIAYSQSDDTFWILNYSNKILQVNKTGTVLGTYDFRYEESLDQCFLDNTRGLLYITAGANYTGRNNIYCFNTNTHNQSIACTVDSYSVEGIWIGETQMVIVNDGYYHSAAIPYNQANIYDLE